MSSLFPETTFLTNLWATPADWQSEVFDCVVRCGHLRAGIDHRIERDSYPGQELILCLAGRGWVQVAGRRHEVMPGQLVWVNCQQPHSYGAVVADPWEVYWVRVEGYSLERQGRLLKIGARPVFSLRAEREVALVFEQIFALVQKADPVEAARCHVAVAELVVFAFESRGGEVVRKMEEMPESIRRTVDFMRIHYTRQHRVVDLAKLAGLSESSYSRLFRKVVGSSPISWLRHLRIQQAKRRLIESKDSIKEISRQMGYPDSHYFSRDFRRMTQLTPTEFRQEEGLALVEDDGV